MTEQKQYSEISIDLETLGKKAGAHIVSLGAVKFNLEDEDTYEGLITDHGRVLHLRANLRALNGDIDGSTLEWWFGQSDEARQVFRPDPLQVSIVDILYRFNEFTRARNYNVWGNGDTFDNVILESAYSRWEMEKNWHFRQDMNLRTLRYAALKKEPNLILDNLRLHGIHHNALDDAIVQALMAQRCWRALNGNINGDELRQQNTGT